MLLRRVRYWERVGERGQEDREGGEGKSREKNRGKQERMEGVDGISFPPASGNCMHYNIHSPCLILYLHS